MSVCLFGVAYPTSLSAAALYTCVLSAHYHSVLSRCYSHSERHALSLALDRQSLESFHTSLTVDCTCRSLSQQLSAVVKTRESQSTRADSSTVEVGQLDAIRTGGGATLAQLAHRDRVILREEERQGFRGRHFINDERIAV